MEKLNDIVKKYNFPATFVEELTKKIETGERMNKLRQKDLKRLTLEKQAWTDEKLSFIEKNKVLLEVEKSIIEEDFEDEIKDLKSELDDYKQKLLNQEGLMKEKDAEVSSLKAERQQLLDRIGTMESEKETMTSENEKLITKNTELQSKLEKHREGFRAVSSEKAVLNKELKALEEKVQKLQKANEQKRKRPVGVDFKSPESKRPRQPSDEVLQVVPENLSTQQQSQASYDKDFGSRASTYWFIQRHTVKEEKEKERHELVKHLVNQMVNGEMSETIRSFDNPELKNLLELFYPEAVRRIRSLFLFGRFETFNGRYSTIGTVILSRSKLVVEFRGSTPNNLTIVYRYMTDDEVKQDVFGMNNHYQGPS